MEAGQEFGVTTENGPGFDMFHASSTIEADSLASLALDAATQLDALERKGEADLTSLRNFADALARFSGLDCDAGAGTYWLDPTSSEMFSNAITRVVHRNVSTVDTLNAELSSIVGSLRAGRSEKLSIGEIKRFCLEIHSFLLKARVTAGPHERGVFDYDHSYA